MESATKFPRLSAHCTGLSTPVYGAAFGSSKRIRHPLISALVELPGNNRQREHPVRISEHLDSMLYRQVCHELAALRSRKAGISGQASNCAAMRSARPSGVSVILAL